MTESSLIWSVCSKALIGILIAFILLVIFWVANANAQFLSVTPPNILTLFESQILPRYSCVIPSKISPIDMLGFKIANSHIYT